MVLSIVQLIREHEPTVVKSIDLTIKKRIAGGGELQDGEFDPNMDPFVAIEGFMDDIVALQKIREQPPSIAFIIAVDGDVPTIREVMQLTQETMGKAKLGVAQIFVESDLDLLRDARLRLAAGNREAYESLIMQYVKTPAALTAMLTRLTKVLLMELVCTGACTYVDPVTGLGFQISYTAQIPAGNMLTALTGGNLWSAPATAKPLENLRDHLNGFFANMQAFPPVIGMSSVLADFLLASPDTKQKIGWMNGAFTTAQAFDAAQVSNITKVDLADCERWLGREITAAAQSAGYRPRILVSDAVWYPRRPDGTIDVANKRPFIPAGFYVFLTPGLVSGAYLPTATNDYQKVVALATDDKYKIQPREEYIGVDTRLMPIVTDPRYLAARKVA